MSDIKDRLLAACNGHPTAAIPWPHRLLHDAIDQIEAQQARIAELEQQLAELRRGVDNLKIRSYELGQQELHDMALELLHDRR